MHPAHFRRLYRRGVFPRPRKTSKGKPYFDYELLVVVAGVLKSGVGQNGEEVSFYRRRRAQRSHATPRRRPERPDGYIATLRDGLLQVGAPKDSLEPSNIRDLLTQLFGKGRPELGTAIVTLARHLLA
jgi:hypothetical protein